VSVSKADYPLVQFGDAAGSSATDLPNEGAGVLGCALFSFKLVKVLNAPVGRHWILGISLFSSNIDTVTAN